MHKYSCDLIKVIFEEMFDLAPARTLSLQTPAGLRHKERLGPNALEYFRAEGSAHSLAWDLLVTEMFGPRRNRLGSGMRFCADMLYSGHTYFT